MKWRWLILSLLVLSLCVISGCEKDDDDDDTVRPPSNTPPTIVSVTADQYVVLPSTIVTFTCVARDDDHDALTYNWYGSPRPFLNGNTSASVEWQAVSTPGDHTIYVDVSDNDETVTDSVIVTVNDQVPRNPSDPSPYDGQENVDLLPTFSWSCSDPQGDPLTYDIYIGLGEASDLVAEGITDTFFVANEPLIPGNFYKWKVLARDDQGNLNTGPEWSFTTISRDYGPPLNDIMFIDATNYVGTMDRPGDQVIYVHNVGRGHLVDDPGYCGLWEPGGDAETSLLAFHDRTDQELVLLSASGTADETYPDAEQDLFSFSRSGSRLCYVNYNQSRGRYYMKSMGVSPIISEDTVYSVAEPYQFASRPSYSTNGSLVATTTYNAAMDDDYRLVIHRAYGPTEYEDNIEVYAPQFSPTDEILAYMQFEADQNDRPKLVITNGSYYPVKTFYFDSYGANAKNFIWSPDGTMIALYVWDSALDPSLVIVDVFGETSYEIEIEDPIRIDPDEEHWLFPDWNHDSDELTFLTEHGTYFHLVRVDLEGNLTDIRPNLNNICRPTWRR